VLAHTAAVITRGLAVHRAPWGNMYEFVTALTCVAAIFFLFVMIRYRAWTLGVFVMGAVVVALGLAETLIYTAAGQLVPALQSYWLDIHVTAMTLATGIFFVAAVLGVVYLIVDRYNRRVAAGRSEPGNGIIRRLPTIEQIDRLPGLDVRRHRGRDLGRPGLGPLLGLGPGGNLGLHHMGALRRVPARQGHRGLAWPPSALHPAARLHQPDVQHPGGAGLHHRPPLLRRRDLTSAVP
jgi:Cytochrome C assembly protein